MDSKCLMRFTLYILQTNEQLFLDQFVAHTMTKYLNPDFTIIDSVKDIYLLF